MALTHQLYHTDIKIGEDAQTQIDFETANEIHFDADNAERVKIDSTGLTVVSGSLETATIDYTDGDLAMTIADGGGVTFAQAVDLGSNTLTSTGSLQVRTIDYSDGDLAMTIADGGGVTFAQAVDLGSNTLTTTGSLQVRTIDYSDGDNAITIADGGGVTFAQNATFSGIIDITDATDASDNSGDTGALRTEGGASIAKKLYVGTDLDVDGTAELDNITIGGAQGSDGQVLTSTGSAVGWEDAGGGGNTRDFVASGAIANGAHVSLNPTGHAAAGKVSTSVSSLKLPVTFSSSSSEFMGSCFDSNSNKVVISYKDSGNSNYGTAVVGTVSGGAITFGTPAIFNSGAIYYTDVSFDSDANKVVIVYRDDSDSYQGTAVVGTVSGTGISFGTEQHYEAGWAYYMVTTFDSNSDKTVIAWKDNDTSYGNAVVATISGTDISFGTVVVFESAAVIDLDIVFDSNSNKVVIVYRDSGNSSYGTAIVGTVSGTDISFGTAAVFESATTTGIQATFDSNSNKVVIVYRDAGDGNVGKGIVGTVSGTAISFGTASASYLTNPSHGGITFVPTVPDGSGGSTAFNKVVVAMQDQGNSNHGTYFIGTVSGTDITFDSAVKVVYYGGNSAYHRPIFDSNSHLVVIPYKAVDNSNYGDAVVVDPSITPNYLNWIGVADAAISDTATGTVNLIGSIDDSQSSLTIGSRYYMQDDGTVTTTSATNREVGRAMSATELLLTQGGVS